ncbi:thioredoxin family protein [Mesonia maritima]|uniref:Thioredoxin-related protein n=1 Tax=Mesonia maritima TaxID=1793873 RepID=A0ABU1K1I8_9FLAO|nr:thioredoxin fold domain-containing protein [Mesonia maritima]MDR6299486.1 thioredoxin-related protein [Mesonia maritima]
MKKQLIFFIAILLSVGVSAQKINWMTMNEALEAQKENPKKIFVDVYTEWCGPCKLLDKNTFQNEDVAKYINKHFYAVKFNAEGTEEVTYKDFTYTNPNHKANKKGRNSQHLFAHALKIRAYPSMVFFDEESEIISPVTGYHTPKQLEIYLKMIANDDYKDLTTQEAWKEYQNNFKNTFSNN